MLITKGRRARDKFNEQALLSSKELILRVEGPLQRLQPWEPRDVYEEVYLPQGEGRVRPLPHFFT